MGLSDFFSKDSRSTRALKKNMARAIDKHAQSFDRYRAMEALRDDGSPDAILGLLRRFSLRYEKSIEDEQEKEWAYQTLCELGERVLPELRRYCKESETIAWGLKVLESVAKGETFQKFLRELCEQNDNSYARDPSKKIQLVHFMGDHRDPVLVELLLPYLEDVDEGVRFTAVEALLAQGQPEALASLLKLLQSTAEESRRIKVRIVQGLASTGWALPEDGGLERLVAELVPGARVGQDRRVVAPPIE